MKKLKKIAALALAAVTAVSAMSISIFAEDADDEVVYTYIDKNNQEVNITQAELDIEHWDKDVLSDVAPYIYEDFPMAIDSFVDDYSDMCLKLTYFKKISDADNVSISITDMDDDSSIYTNNIDENSFSSPNIEMNKIYKITLSETFDGVTKEYYKVVTTSVESAEMPDYVANSETTDETIILVGDVDNLRASTAIDEDGGMEIFTDMPRYEQVKACDFTEYVDNLDTNKLYRIYTRDSGDNRYFGFISTYGDISGIFMPSISVYSWDTFNAPAMYTASSSSLTSSQILNGTTTEITNYRDYEFSYSSSDRDFEVFKFKVPACEDEGFDIYVYANDSITMEIWSQQPDAKTLTYEDTNLGRNGYIELHTLMEFQNGAILENGYVYFVFYFNGTVSNGEGLFSIQNTADSDDVSGSAYEVYEDFLNGTYTQYKSWTPFYITNDRDVDVFFLNYGTSSKLNYVRVNVVDSDSASNYNNKTTQKDKYIELAHTASNQEILRPLTDPDDIMTLNNDATSYLKFSATSTTSSKKFVYIYNVPSSKNVKNDIYLLKRFNN